MDSEQRKSTWTGDSNLPRRSRRRRGRKSGGGGTRGRKERKKEVMKASREAVKKRRILTSWLQTDTCITKAVAKGELEESQST